MRGSRGYVSNGPGVEADVAGCAHCRAQFELRPAKGCESVRVDRCGACDAPICLRCAAELARTLKCVPFEKRLDVLESRHRLRVAAGVEPRRNV